MPVLTNEREYRNLAQPLTAQAGDEARTVEGYATTFDSEYLLWDSGSYAVYERVDSRAFEGCDMTDVIMQYDHQGRVFARSSNGTLELATDAHGLRVRADLSGTELGRQLYDEIRGGYTTRMSFGFTVAEDKWEEITDHNTGRVTAHRTILKLKKLYDVSAVSLPANDATEISARALSDGWIRRAEQERLKARQAEENRRKIQIILEVTQ